MLKDDFNFENHSGSYIEHDLIRRYERSIQRANQARADLAESEYLLSFSSLETLVAYEREATTLGRFIMDFQFEMHDKERGFRDALIHAYTNAVRAASYGGESTSNTQRLIDYYERKAWESITTDREIIKAVRGEGKIQMVDVE